VNVSNSQTVFFQQLALNVEAVSNKWSALGYWLMPIGQYGWGQNTQAQLNSVYGGDSLNTIGGDIAYNITPDVKLSLGYYYQDGDLGAGDSSGVKSRLAYDIANGVTVGFTYSYDAAFQSVATGDIKWRFGTKGYGSPKKQKPPVMPVIEALSTTPANRDVRVHDEHYYCAGSTRQSPYICSRGPSFQPPAPPNVCSMYLPDFLRKQYGC
jgi:hypothetical protein